MPFDCRAIQHYGFIDDAAFDTTLFAFVADADVAALRVS